MTIPLHSGFRLAGIVALMPFLLSTCSRDERPNVVLIVIDTFRVDHLGCYGAAADLSPRIDELGKRDFPRRGSE